MAITAESRRWHKDFCTATVWFKDRSSWHAVSIVNCSPPCLTLQTVCGLTISRIVATEKMLCATVDENLVAARRMCVACRRAILRAATIKHRKTISATAP